MRKRYIVVALLAGLSVITFLDRMVIAVTGPAIQRDLHVDPIAWGWVLSAYVLAYSLFEIPSGALGDRHGYRRELSRITIWWSFFTLVTMLCRNVWQIATARFLFGAGAAGAYPNISGVLYRWLPARERARGQGVIWSASRLGGALAPLLLVPLELLVGWRWVFAIMGLIGFAWVIAWRRLYVEHPVDMPGIGADELAEIGEEEPGQHHGVAWRRLFALPQLWLIAAAYFFYAFGAWFFFGWFPTWLIKARGFSTAQMGLYAAIPFILGVIANLAGGLLCEWLERRIGARIAYRLIAATCLAVTAALMAVMAYVQNGAAVIVLAGASFGVMDLMLPSAWAMCMTIGGRLGGTATAVMNTLGNLGGFVCAAAFGYLVQGTGDYDLPVKGIAGMIAISAGLFALIDCTRGIAQSGASPAIPQTA
ncbi:MAG: MFS transporter [Sphingomonas sp.]|uniref:MFS transporter n=1 Tax=Sphingomonas sp. TaxID=28214 RepID=UPI003F7D5C01